MIQTKIILAISSQRKNFLMGQYLPLFCFIFVLFTLQFRIEIEKSKRRRSAWDSNPVPQDQLSYGGRHWDEKFCLRKLRLFSDTIPSSASSSALASISMTSLLWGDSVLHGGGWLAEKKLPNPFSSFYLTPHLPICLSIYLSHLASVNTDDRRPHP